MSNKENLIAYLLRNGKDLSWHELAMGFGYQSADAARSAWNRYREDNPGTPTFVNRPARDNVSQHFGRPHIRHNKEQYVMDLEEKVTKYEEDLQKGTAQVEALVNQEIKTLDELIDKCKIDLNKWQIVKWTQNFWNNRYQVKAQLAPKEEKNRFQENFVDFLKTYVPTGHARLTPGQLEEDEQKRKKAFEEAKVFEDQCKEVTLCGRFVDPNPKGCLVINKQDLHFNKYDINGNNDIKHRFTQYRESIVRILKKAELSYKLTDVIYVIGSDEFNSEWTGMTTKGTPQQNMIDYHQGFMAICDHEVSIIDLLRKVGRTVKVIYMPGNHDEYVGWHMITWLQVHFKGQTGLSFDISPSYRKYMQFGNSAMMFNHGDIVKPEKLASIFPQEFKEYWSQCDYQYIFTGDKHHEKTLDMDGIMFYQLTQGSNATSKWDSKQGYLAKGFLTAFVISERWGMADIYKERL